MPDRSEFDFRGDLLSNRNPGPNVSAFLEAHLKERRDRIRREKFAPREPGPTITTISNLPQLPTRHQG